MCCYSSGVLGKDSCIGVVIRCVEIRTKEGRLSFGEHIPKENDTIPDPTARRTD